MKANMEINHRTPTIKLNSSTWLSLAARYIVLIAICVIVIVPLLIAIFSSFKTTIQIGGEFSLKPPSQLNFDNYKIVFTQGKIFTGFMNSMILVVVSVVVNALLSAMTAYCLNRFDFKLKKVVLGLFVVGMIMPAMITEISRFSVIKNLGLYNSIWAPIVIYAAANLMQLYIYFQFMEKIPRSLDESALIDGGNYFTVFWKIVFPLMAPATATLGIIKAVDVINDMYVPYLYMPSEKLRTLTTTLMYFSSSKFGAWEYLSAAIVVVMLPTLLIYLIFQKYIFAGIVAGAVKE
ncbi:carbohydrate ABC transporter permease [Paenibacillus sp. N1-5-1-14]|uniref:carbohydrate ABC transporter permease n=1 Tax=Paenibacillus radicibacter TaxID=2972488 RepID=UPI002158E77C|nr:carbohydrate ABC transporter permease [Paenibacillus radicibacter]MCR8643060.1 carbohydrate ABC transporter permease [Paenibacillus radicibacter]